ncbi:MAG: PBP1A family penicillin-binding protein [Proteobacteria bacterium]|nr:PBP1A family penicillin-binding protein [Pseudomonadota bacterium]
MKKSILKKPKGLVQFFLLICIAGFLGIAIFCSILLWNLPSVASLKKYKPAVSTEVYSKEFIKVGEFFEERRMFVPFEKIPPMLIHAFISAEDASFYDHGGISVWAIARAAIKNMEAGYKKQGGSTITQQVARGMLLSNKKEYTRKIREIMLAILMEKYLTKQEILEIYLNQVYLGQSSYGVQAASHVYYGKNVQDLSLAEIAIMAGLTKAPSRDNPATNLTAAKRRQGYVLQRLLEDKHILAEEKEAALKTPLVIKHDYDLNHEIAPYFVESIRQYVMGKYGSDRVLKEGLQVITTLEYRAAIAANRALKKGVEELDHRRGFRGPIRHYNNNVDEDEFLKKQKSKYTMEDLQPGEIFEALVTKADSARARYEINLGFTRDVIPYDSFEWFKNTAIKEHDVISVRYDGAGFTVYQYPQVQGSIIALNPMTGEISAMVGGYDFKKSEFNRTTQGKRQPGSAFKPIIYTAALDNGYTPGSVIVDAPIVYDDPTVEFQWKPHNYGGKFYGDTIFRECLILSRNIPTIKIVQSLGLDKIIEYANKMGITSNFERNFSIALGSSIMSPMELVTAYSVFASGGKRPKSSMIKQISDRAGNILEQNSLNMPDISIEDQVKAYEENQKIKLTHLAAIEKGIANEELPEGYAISPQTSYIMTNLLKEVITSGTGARAAALQRPAAGKTGTTNDNYDAWFVGYTPNIVSAVWLGLDEAQTLGANEEGGKAAVPVWLEFMQQTLDGKPVRDFQMPKGVLPIAIDPKTGKLPSSKTERTVTEIFKEGTEPTEISSNPHNSKKAADFFLDE